MKSNKAHGIEVFLRVRPTKKFCNMISKIIRLLINLYKDLEAEENSLSFTFPKDGSKSGNMNA